MRMVDRAQHLHVQRESIANSKLPGIAIVVQRRAFHILQRQVVLAAVGDAGLDQLRDPGVVEPLEELTLAREARKE